MSCEMVFGYKAAACKKPKGKIRGGRTNGGKGGSIGNGGSEETCNFCGIKWA